MENNLELYNKVRTVPENAQKEFNNGSFKGTDINPMWRIKTLTENFGPAGFGWYIEEIERWSEVLDTDVAVYCKIHLFVKDPDSGEWSKPIVGIGGSRSIQQYNNSRKVSDEGYKMAYTDAISVACKALGIGADIYWEKDRTKYTQNEEDNAKDKQEAAKPATKTKTATATAPKFRPITMTEKDAQLRQLLGQWVAEGYKREGCEQTMNNAYKVTIPDEVWNEALKVL